MTNGNGNGKHHDDDEKNDGAESPATLQPAASDRKPSETRQENSASTENVTAKSS